MATKKISLKRLAHVYYKHADFDAACKFLHDFGFKEVARKEDRVYFGGYGVEPWVYCAIRSSQNEFGGAAWIVDSPDDLELALKILPGASEVYLENAPGGGRCVSFTDPVDGFEFHLVHGQSSQNATDPSQQMTYNFPNNKLRAANKTQRMAKGPAPVHKIGHFGVCVTNYDRMFDFFTSNFNLKPSDIIYDGNDKHITAFFHLDRGSEWVDHHVFFFYEGPKPHVHHSSFEVHDFDVQLLGHYWLQQNKYELVWGVGRHVMGSQIFDYWYDPSKFILEHYADGDLVNDESPTNYTKAGPDNLHVWGPDVPATFLS